MRWQRSVAWEEPGHLGILQGWVLMTFSFLPVASTLQPGSRVSLFLQGANLALGQGPTMGQPSQPVRSLHHSHAPHSLSHISFGPDQKGLGYQLWWDQDKGRAWQEAETLPRMWLQLQPPPALSHCTGQVGGQWRGHFPCRPLQSSIPRAGDPCTRHLVDLAGASPQGGKETPTPTTKWGFCLISPAL